MKTKKIILIAVAVVVVAGAGIWFFAGSPAKHKVTYATANVSKGDISNSVTDTGNLRTDFYFRHRFDGPCSSHRI